MKKFMILAAVAMLVGRASAAVRDTISLNAGWQFHLGELSGIEAVKNAKSERVNLPHDFLIPNLPFNDWGVTAYKLQRELLHRYDNTRLTTVAMHPRYRDIDTDSIISSDELAVGTERSLFMGSALVILRAGASASCLFLE